MAFDSPRSDLFRHATADKAALYRAVMEAFAAAKRQFRLHLRPDEATSAAAWPGVPPSLDEVQLALAQLVAWGNLQAQPDTARVSTVEDFYRARFLYSLTPGGEAAEAGFAAFVEALTRRGELQSVALEDILARLTALKALARAETMDAAKIHETFRDLVTVFTGLAENAQAFMAGLARSIELQRADLDAVMTYKARLVDYLERFIGDLVTLSARIGREIVELQPLAETMLQAIARREARDVAPDSDDAAAALHAGRLDAWRERWSGLAGWFVGDPRQQAQSELLRARARAAIPRLLSAVAALNERRTGRSDRSADYRALARWFVEARSEDEGHRLWRAAFALNPARHVSVSIPAEDVSAATPWAQAPTAQIVPRLRERGQLTPRGAPPRVRDKSEERELLARRLVQEDAQVQAARARLANAKPTRLSELGKLDRHEFGLFLGLLAEALSAQGRPDQPVERLTADGLHRIRLEPLHPATQASLETELGTFTGRDHVITISAAEHIAS